MTTPISYPIADRHLYSPYLLVPSSRIKFLLKALDRDVHIYCVLPFYDSAFPLFPMLVNNWFLSFR